jgi:hypothetical protein
MCRCRQHTPYTTARHMCLLHSSTSWSAPGMARCKQATLSAWEVLGLPWEVLQLLMIKKDWLVGRKLVRRYGCYIACYKLSTCLLLCAVHAHISKLEA